MSTNITTNVKFIREQGGAGPNCYPGSLGEADRDQCLDKVFRRMEYEMNNKVERMAFEFAVPGFSSVGMLGDAFYRPVLGSAGGGSKTMYGVFLASLADEAQFKNKYNSNLRQNMRSVPPVSSVASAGSRRLESRVQAVSSYVDVFRDHEGDILDCYCEEYIQKTCKWIDITWDTPAEDDSNTDDGKDNSDPSTETSPRNNITGENEAIPIVVGRMRILARLIERRSDELVFGVCQNTSNMIVHRVWFYDTLIFERGAMKTDDATYVTPDKTTYKDLFCIRIGNADLNSILFKYKGVVRVEVITDSQNAGATTDTLNNTQLLFADIQHNVFLMKKSNGDIIIHNGQTIPSSVFAAYVIGAAGATYNRHDECVYWTDKKADLLSGGVETLKFPLNAPFGFDSENNRFNNTHYINSDGDIQTFAYPQAQATLFVGKIGFNFTSRLSYNMDIYEGTVTSNNLPASFTLSFWMHAPHLNTIFLFSPSGTVWAINDYTGEFMSSAELGDIIPRASDVILSGDVIMLSSAGKVRLFSPTLMQCTDTDYVVPVGYSYFTYVNGTFIGTTFGGDTLFYQISTSSLSTTSNFAAALSTDMPFAIGGDLEQISGFSAEDKSVSYLDFARNFCYAYNKTLFEYTDSDDALFIGDIDLQPTVVPLLTTTERYDALSFTDEEADTANELTMNARDTAYEDLQLKLDGQETSSTFTTTAIMSSESLAELAPAYLARIADERAGKTLYTCALGANIEAVNGGNVYGVEHDVTTNQAKLKMLPYTGLKVELPLPTYAPDTIEPVFSEATLPGFFTSYNQVNRAVICQGHQVGAILTPLVMKHSYYMMSDDQSVDIEFISPPTGLHTSVDYEELINDPFLNLVCIGGEWIQYQTLTILTPTKINLSGLFRGRFLTFPNETHAVGTPAHFYSADLCTISNTTYGTEPLIAVPTADFLEFQYKVVKADEDLFQFGITADDPNYEDEYVFTKFDLQLFMYAFYNGYMSIDELYDPYWYISELKSWLKFTRLDPFWNWRIGHTTPDYTIDWTVIDTFFKGRGVADHSKNTYTVKTRTFIGTRIRISRYNNRQFFVKGYVNGVELTEQPIYTDRYVRFLTEFNPYKDTFTYEISSL